jgi:SH3/ankyrin repeat-containing protein
LRGAKAASPLMQLKPSSRCPALQYLDDVDKGGVADVAGLKKGDFLLAVSPQYQVIKFYSRSYNE